MLTRLKQLKRALALLGDPAVQQLLGEMSDDFARVSGLRKRFPTCHIDASVLLHDRSIEGIVLGEQVRLARGVVIALTEAGGTPPALSIGFASYIGEYCNLRAAAGTRIEIGTRCLISQFCSIIADNHATPRDQLIATAGVEAARSGVRIGDDVWVGVGASVLAGVTIGNGVVIGANSVVNADVPAYEIWAGSPARKIGART